MDGEGKSPLPIFDGEDFSVWKSQVEAYLIAKEKFFVLESDSPRRYAEGKATPEQVAAKEASIMAYAKADKQVKSLLILALDRKHAKQVMTCTTAKQLWDRLVSMHQQKSEANQILLQQQFFTLKLKRDENVRDYIARAEYIYGQLKNFGVATFNEQILVNTIVAGLPGPYFTFMSYWAKLQKEEQRLPKLIAQLSAEEQLVNKFKKPTEEHAFVAESRTKSNRDKKPGKGCWICGDEGHMKKDCPKRSSEADDQKDKDQDKGKTKDKNKVKRRNRSDSDNSDNIC